MPFFFPCWKCFCFSGRSGQKDSSRLQNTCIQSQSVQKILLWLLSQLRWLGKAATANDVQLLWEQRMLWCIFLHLECSNIPQWIFWFFLLKRMLRQWDRVLECLLCILLQPQPTFYWVYASSPDANTQTLQVDPAFCSYGLPCRISMLEVLKGENVFPPEFLWFRPKPAPLNWGFRSSLFHENMVYELILTALC